VAEETKAVEKQTAPDFTKVLEVGYMDRGMGHGSYAVLNRYGQVVAKVNDNLDPDAVPLSFRDDARANTLLFAASPDMYSACETALEELRKAGLGESAAAQKLIAAMKKAVEVPQPPESQEGKVE
jgi:hypothetical protein